MGTQEPGSDTSRGTMPQEEKTRDIPVDISVIPLMMTSEHDKKQLSVIIRQEALDKARKHAFDDTSRETGGVMLGRFIENETTVTVIFTGIVRALRAVRATSSVNFTPETWAEIWQAIDKDKDYSDDSIWSIVGWYHTHPGFGIFLSGFDKFIQKEYFTRKGHLALVIDPEGKGKGNDVGFFMTDKETGETPNISDKVISIMKNDKELLKKLNKTQTQHLFLRLPPSEIDLKGGD